MKILIGEEIFKIWMKNIIKLKNNYVLHKQNWKLVEQHKEWITYNQINEFSKQNLI